MAKQDEYVTKAVAVYVKALSKKQVNVLMEESLLEHMEKLANVVSLLCSKKITISDIVRKSVIDYSRYGKVSIESAISKDHKMEVVIKPVINGDHTNDELMRKICAEDW